MNNQHQIKNQIKRPPPLSLSFFQLYQYNTYLTSEFEEDTKWREDDGKNNINTIRSSLGRHFASYWSLNAERNDVCGGEEKDVPSGVIYNPVESDAFFFFWHNWLQLELS